MKIGAELLTRLDDTMRTVKAQLAEMEAGHADALVSLLAGNKTARGFPAKTSEPRAFLRVRSPGRSGGRNPKVAAHRTVVQPIVFMASSVRFLAPHFSRIVLT